MIAIPILLLGVLVALDVAYWILNRRINQEITDLISRAEPGPGMVITEAMLMVLPEPIRRYLKHAGVVGRKIPRTVRLKQVGKMRKDANSAWMSFVAEEHYSITPPGLVWKACFPHRRFPVVFGRDRYEAGHGSILMKMFSLIPVADAKNDERLDQGAMLRYLNEMMWFPQAFLGNNISWSWIDENSAEVTLTDTGKTVSAVIRFDAEGKLINFVARRHRMVGKGYDLETWSTPVSRYAEFEGLKLPAQGAGVWNLEEGDFEYIRLALTDVRYDF